MELDGSGSMWRVKVDAYGISIYNTAVSYLL